MPDEMNEKASARNPTDSGSLKDAALRILSERGPMHY